MQIELHVTHRLDVPVEGCLVFAKSKEAQARFNKALLKNKIEKKYRALVTSFISPGTLIHYIQKNKSVPKILTDAPKPGLLHCELEILTCEPFRNDFEVTLRLITGRTHQIRAQVSAVGASILGDTMYGGPESKGYSETRIALQAYALCYEGIFRLELPRPWA